MNAEFAQQLNVISFRIASHHTELSRILAEQSDLEAKRAKYLLALDYNTRELGDAKSIQSVLDEAEYDVESVALLDRYNQVQGFIARDHTIRCQIVATIARQQIEVGASPLPGVDTDADGATPNADPS